MAGARASTQGGHRQLLETTLQLRPNDANVLQALASYLRDAGQEARAAETQRKLELLRQE